MRARLHVHVFIHGHLYEPGDEVTLTVGQRGPHRTHPRLHEHLDVDEDQKRIMPQHVDEPLYETWDESAKAWTKPK